MTPSFFDTYGPQPLRKPRLLVLDAAEKIQPILLTVATIPGLTWDDEDVLRQVMQSIQYEHRALSQLHDDCLQLMAKATGVQRYDMLTSGGRYAVAASWSELAPAGTVQGETHWVNEATELATRLTELGTYLFLTLRNLGCYEGGFLNYQFKQWLGKDLVLVRFEPLGRNVDEYRLDPAAADTDTAYSGAADRVLP